MKTTFDFDVIVVGSGMSGGIAAKEFCEKGYKTLVLDRGKPLAHRQYKTENKAPWEMPFRGKIPEATLAEEFPIQRKCYALSEYTQDYFIKDNENPYQQEKPFDWIRSSTVGGKSQLWHRQSYRWNKMDFEANSKDGHGIDWPIRYEDIEPWYDYIEPFIGISGSKEGLEVLPDGKFLPPLVLNVVEKEFKAEVEKTFPQRKVIPSRTAHLTKPTPEHMKLGRGQCQARNECQRGCSWGGFYSSLSGGLAAAELTGNMTLTANAQVQQVLYDEKTNKATGVSYVDTQTNERKTVTAKTVFMCASALASVQILLNSKSTRFPNGIGNSSGTLGHYVTDHVGGSGASGRLEAHQQTYYQGRRPGGIYIPRFRNVNGHISNNYFRGFGFQGGAGRADWRAAASRDGIGESFKLANRLPGDWWFSLWGFGEMLPMFENRVYLNEEKTDKWGMPLLVTSVDHDATVKAMKEDITKCAVEMLQAAGFKDVSGVNGDAAPGLLIHEMGGACMGKDPKTSYLNKWAQSHDVENLFVTDGAAFSSGSCVNPSITFMALTARAVDYADTLIKQGKI